MLVIDALLRSCTFKHDAKSIKAVRQAGSGMEKFLDRNHVIRGLIGPFFDECNAVNAKPGGYLRDDGQPKAA
jgi:hypothetical protein